MSHHEHGQEHGDNHNKKIHKCPTEGENYDSPQIISKAKETANIIKNQELIKLTKDSIILDFGAGTGLIGLNFINQVKKVIFEDVSKPMLDYLEYKLENKGIKNYTIFNGIIEDFNTTEKIDLITAGMVLHHVEDLQSVFNKFIQLLKPKGFLVVTDLRKNAPMFSIGEHMHNHNHKHVMPHKGFEPEELCQKMKKAGFVTTEVIRISSINFKEPSGKETISERFMIVAQGP